MSGSISILVVDECRFLEVVFALTIVDKNRLQFGVRQKINIENRAKLRDFDSGFKR